MVQVEYTPVEQSGAKSLKAVHAKHTTDPLHRKPVQVAIVVVVLALIVAVQIWLQQRGPAATMPATNTQAANTQPGVELAPNGLPLPPPTARQKNELTEEEVREGKFTPARAVDEEQVRIGEISWSDTNPRVRINHFWHEVGATVRDADDTYTIVRIERDRVLIRDSNGVVRDYAPGKLYGINSDLMQQYRNNIENKIRADNPDAASHPPLDHGNDR